MNVVYKTLDRLGGWILPACCVLCRRPGSAPRRDLCAACEADLPRLPLACAHCGHVPASATATCPACHDRPPPYDRCFAAYTYAFPLDRLIPALKYEGALTLARVPGVLLGEAVAAQRARLEVDVIVPMPLHATRRVERGYNQASEIARWTAATLDTPMDEHALARTRATTAQVGLDRDERRRNVQGAFAACPARVAGRRVALLDDVVTTGSTAAAAAIALRDAGAVRVEAWSVARALA